MRTLTELPDGMSIFVPPTQNTVTWALYQEYLMTIKLDPSASILAKASAESAYRAARRKSQEEHDAWHARSRLGETGGHDASSHSASTTQDAGEARPKWSLWGRKASTPIVPLTTSGGGLLEVKALSPNPTGLSDNQSRKSVQLASIPTSSRSTPPPVRSADTQTPSEHNEDTFEAPSAVGRFLGRFRRPKPVTPSVDVSNKDLELSQDDFSFLADVPALSNKANTHDVDLLSLDDSNPSGQMASLEATLNSTSLPLAPHLMPPPRPTAFRESSSALQALPKPSMAQSQPASKSNSMIDLFGDLDFGGTTSPKATPPVSNGLEIDSFVRASTPPAAQVRKAFRPSSVVLPQPVSVTASSTNPVFGMSASSEDDGFGNFNAQSQAKSNHTFDDFGDFEEFSTDSSAKRNDAFALPAAAPPISHAMNAIGFPQIDNTLQTRSAQVSSSRLDHSSTAKLVQTAAQQTSQWPAAVSPSIPALPPPTSARQPAAIPPPPTSGYRKGTPLNFDFLGAGPSSVDPPRSTIASPAPPLLASSNTASRSQTPQLSKGQGLTASDLSFFDSL